MKEVSKKMRLQLFDKDFNQIDDRLVSQNTEIYKGVKEVWEGPLKVEVCLFSKTDVDDFKNYLDQLVGNLPIEESRKRKRGRKKLSKTSPDYRKEFGVEFDKAVVAGNPIDWVKEEGFIFTSLDFLKDLGLPFTIPEEIEPDDFKWMVRLTKRAKNPLNNKYDPTILIGIEKLSTGKIKKARYVLVTPDGIDLDMEGDLVSKSLKVPPQVKVKFPHFLTPEERVRLSLEIGELRKDDTKKPSPLYRRWIWAVSKENEGKGITFPKIDTIPNPYA